MFGAFSAVLPPEFPFPEPQPVLPGPESSSPPVPIVYEKDSLDALTPRMYAAIHLRVPDSGVGWLDAMIRRSRELDALPQ
jgi:hypothetical protein